MKSLQKILFILKRREDYDPSKHTPKGLSTGLFNSANFIVEMLNESGIYADIEVAIDNNCIDRLVHRHKPTHVIIEALWVVPMKFYELIKLHPGVKWIVRLHSEMPFLANEGIAMDWIGDYVSYPEISIAVNAPRMLEEIKLYLSTKYRSNIVELDQRIIYLPNFYPQTLNRKIFNREKYWIDIACFGAVRPLKNHLLQAFAAIDFANRLEKQLRFHINLGRIEMKGDPIINNLRSLFEHLSDHGHEMIGHEWSPREQFLEICKEMDIGMQCNFSETFNIVSADLISQGVPILGSKEIPWSSRLFNSDPTQSKEIADMMMRIYRFPEINVLLNQRNLNKYSDKSRKTWLSRFGANHAKVQS